MEFSKLLEERRSIRAYKAGAKISKEEIEQMIYAAQQAPSWKNSQTGRYFVALSDEAVKALRNTCLPGFNYERTENVCAFIVTAFEKGSRDLSLTESLPMNTETVGGAMILASRTKIFCSRQESLAMIH